MTAVLYVLIFVGVAGIALTPVRRAGQRREAEDRAEVTRSIEHAQHHDVELSPETDARMRRNITQRLRDTP